MLSLSHLPKVASLLILPFLLQGCGLFSSNSKDVEVSAQRMEISVNMQDVHHCSRISPEIVVKNPPKGTALYEVRLVEKNGPDEVFLGGGTWTEDGSGIIPEGALTSHYRGPCPPQQRREYVFIVNARAANNPQPLSVRMASFVLE